MFFESEKKKNLISLENFIQGKEIILVLSNGISLSEYYQFSIKYYQQRNRFYKWKNNIIIEF